MPRPSRLPGKTGCLSSCSRSARKARSKRFCAARDARLSSAGERRGERAPRSVMREARERQRWEGLMASNYDINELKRRMQGAISVLKTELSGLRTGRASAHLLDPVHVDAYGQSMALNQVATVSIPQPRVISVQVWDRSMLNAVEKAIMAANLGLTPSSEGQVIHLRIPELNEERRKELVKVAHKYAETAKVAVRHVRRDGMDVLKKMEKDHQISEDDHKRMDGEVQKATDQAIVDIDQLLSAKQKEIMTV